MTSASDRWAEQARYDLETAQAMMESGRYLYVLFCCQQAVEKMLKALIANQTHPSITPAPSPFDASCRGSENYGRREPG